MAQVAHVARLMQHGRKRAMDDALQGVSIWNRLHDVLHRPLFLMGLKQKFAFATLLRTGVVAQ